MLREWAWGLLRAADSPATGNHAARGLRPNAGLRRRGEGAKRNAVTLGEEVLSAGLPGPKDPGYILVSPVNGAVGSLAKDVSSLRRRVVVCFSGNCRLTVHDTP